MYNNKNKITIMINLALFITIEVILSRFLSISTPIVKIGFVFIPLALCGMLYGPVCAGAVGALSDIIGANLFPMGMYFPGFTISGALSGVMYGLFLHGKRNCTWSNLIILVLIQRLFLGLGLSTYWLTILTDIPFSVLIAARVLQTVILIPLQIGVLRTITQKIPLFSFSVEQ